MYSLMRGFESESEYGVEFLLRIQGSLVERQEIRLVGQMGSVAYNGLVVYKRKGVGTHIKKK